MTEQRVDYYDVLETAATASAAEIARAYRRQVRRVHPDTRPADDQQTPASGGRAQAEPAGEALALLREAFAVLGDPARRAAYDRHTRTGPVPRTATPQAQQPAPVPRAPHRHEPYLAGPPDPPLRAGPVRYRPSPPRGGER